MSPAQEFRARIYKVGILRCVDLPERVGRHFSRWRNAPVQLAIGRHACSTRLVPRKEGGYRAFLDARLRQAVGVDAGDEVKVSVQLDLSIDREPFPDDVLQLAESIEGGLQALMLLPPGLKRQILKFLGEARTPAARAKRVRRLEELLRERIDS